MWSVWRPIYRWTWAQAQKSSYEHAAEWLKGKKTRVLDVGTGTGEYIVLLPIGNRYTFTDIHQASLDKAKARAQKYLNDAVFDFQKISAEEALEKNPEMDVILMVHVISVIGNHEDLIRKAMKALKPGGSLLVYINRFSRSLAMLDNPVLLGLGFKLINVDAVNVPHSRNKVGWMNECYEFKKQG